MDCESRIFFRRPSRASVYWANEANGNDSKVTNPMARSFMVLWGLRGGSTAVFCPSSPRTTAGGVSAERFPVQANADLPTDQESACRAASLGHTKLESTVRSLTLKSMM